MHSSLKTRPFTTLRLAVVLGAGLGFGLGLGSCADAPAGEGPGDDLPADAGALDGGTIGAGGSTWPKGVWTWLPVEGSRCASGGGAGVGVNAGSSAGSAEEELLLFLQGGGACWNAGTCVPSTLQFGPVCDYSSVCPPLTSGVPGAQQPTAQYVLEPDPFPTDGGGFFPSEAKLLSDSAVLQRSRPENPFARATVVYVPYCTGDLHAGDTTRTFLYRDSPAGSTVERPFHFAGGRNLELYLAYLKQALPRVRTVWLTGTSAGGYGAVLNLHHVRAAFPAAKVHVLADSAPLLATPRWSEWLDTWGARLPPDCSGCDAGVEALVDHLNATQAQGGQRLGLMAYASDPIIAWFMFAPPGLAAYLSPPVGEYALALEALKARFDASGSSRYFIVPGSSHAAWGAYGSALPDGGTTPSVASADGGTTLRAWVDAWALGDGGFVSHR